MSPRELFEEARLREALAAQVAVVKQSPDNIGERLLLCDFLAFAGDRAAVREHLQVLSHGPAEVREYAAEWQQLLQADELRHGGDDPRFLLEPPAHVETRLKAWTLLAKGKGAKALDLIDDADESDAWVEGFVDGRPFEGWRDTDDLLGPVLELFADGNYFWIPVAQVRKLRLEPVEEIRDRLFRPATVQLVDRRKLELFLPALYAGTSDHGEDGIRIGAGVDWVERAGLMRGAGAKTYLFGEEELALDEFCQLEVRSG